MIGPTAAQAGERTGVALPAQAQVAAWVRQRARRIAGPGWFCWPGQKYSDQFESFFFRFSFSSKGFISWKIKNANWLKRKYRKDIFSLWVKFKKLSIRFPLLKKKYILQ